MTKIHQSISTGKIQCSTDWAGVETALTNKTRKLEYGREVRLMIGNAGISVTELSKAEVDARRGKTNKARELLEKVNAEINLIEEYLLVAALIGQKWE